MKIHELKYSNTNTYLIEGTSGNLLFDTGWAGTYLPFCQAMGNLHIPVQKIDYILISHYHPDHMGIVQEIANQGAVLLAAEEQRAYIHACDAIFAKENKSPFVPIADDRVEFFSLANGRNILKRIGLNGQILHTPGHSDDSISLLLDSGELFVGDLNPLYELELHRGTQIGDSWDKLLTMHPRKIYYGHAKTAELDPAHPETKETGNDNVSHEDLYRLVSMIMKMIDKGTDLKKIQKKTGADKVFIEDVTRMYLTHQNVGVQGILDRIEIKNK